MESKKLKTKQKNPIEVEPLNSIEDVLNAAKEIAYSKIYIPENIKKKYKFTINKKTKECLIEEKRSKTKTSKK